MAGRVQDKVAIGGGGGRVPLGHNMGTAWDVAHAALFLHSDWGWQRVPTATPSACGGSAISCSADG